MGTRLVHKSVSVAANDSEASFTRYRQDYSSSSITAQSRDGIVEAAANSDCDAAMRSKVKQLVVYEGLHGVHADGAMRCL